MDCPACGKAVTQTETPEGGLRFYCESCGWGLSPTSASDPSAHGRALSGAKLAILWLISIAVILGPYLCLRFGIPYLADVGIDGLDAAGRRLVRLLDIHSWWIMGVYIFLAAVFNPSYDPHKVGWFGGMLDNPFSLEDDYNRTMRTFAFLLAPGKLVWVTLGLSVGQIRGSVQAGTASNKRDDR